MVIQDQRKAKKKKNPSASRGEPEGSHVWRAVKQHVDSGISQKDLYNLKPEDAKKE